MSETIMGLSFDGSTEPESPFTDIVKPFKAYRKQT